MQDVAGAGDWMRERRKLLNIRREDLMAPTGLSLATIARIETGKPAHRATILTLAGILKLDNPAAEALADWHAEKISRNEFLCAVQ